MNITAEKNEIIQWIDSLDNPSVIERIKMIKMEAQSFHFDKEWEKGISVGGSGLNYLIVTKCT